MRPRRRFLPRRFGFRDSDPFRVTDCASAGRAPRLGQPFVLENRPGAGATLGTGVVADAAPDGYTVLLSAISAFSVGSTLYRGRITWDPIRSFAHVGMIQSGYYALMANNAAPFANPGELAAAARARPGIAYATSGVGSLTIR